MEVYYVHTQKDIQYNNNTVPSEVLVHSFVLQGLDLQLDGTFVEVRQQRLRVADQEVKLHRLQFL